MEALEKAMDRVIQQTIDQSFKRLIEAMRTAAPIYKGQDGEFAINNFANSLEKTNLTSDEA